MHLFQSVLEVRVEYPIGTDLEKRGRTNWWNRSRVTAASNFRYSSRIKQHSTRIRKKPI